MRDSRRHLVAILGLVLGLTMPCNVARADSRDLPDLRQLSTEWWQWILSIPTPVNPLRDDTGDQCMVGQRGSTWFLAGNAGGTTERTCAVPAGKALFFPVINVVNVDTPNVCGQGPDRIPIGELRAPTVLFINAASNLTVTVDGVAVSQRRIQRIQSKVFDVALPEENLFDDPCIASDLGDVPGGIYAPAVEAGFYVRLNPLPVGTHTIHIHAEHPNFGSPLDVTYHLTIVPGVDD